MKKIIAMACIAFVFTACKKETTTTPVETNDSITTEVKKENNTVKNEVKNTTKLATKLQILH